MPDVVVVGGGVAGASVAHRCVVGGATTLLVDRRDVGRATDAGAGIVSPETQPRDGGPVRALGLRAGTHYPTLVDVLAADGETDTGYARCGHLVVATTPEHAAVLDLYLDLLVGPDHPGPPVADVELVDPAAARDLFPPLGEVHAAFWSPTAARVDGRRLEASLRGAARRRGLETSDADVSGVVVERDRVVGVRVAGDVIAAGAVVLAGGAWTPALARSVGVEVDVVPQRGQIAHLRLGRSETGAWPVVSPLTEHYLVAFPEGRVVAGATRESGAGFDPTPTAAGVAEVLREALRVAPGLADAELVEVRVGLRPLAPDGRPTLGPVPGVDGLHVCSGHGASGLTLGPWSGWLVGEGVLGHDAAIDPAFAPGRPTG